MKITKEEIISILNRYTFDDFGFGGTHNGISPKDYSDVAQEIISYLEQGGENIK